MGKNLSTLFFLILIVSVSSCTTDNDDNIKNSTTLIVGVWEQDGFFEVSGQRLVFAANHSGSKIFRNTDGGLVTSSAFSFLWETDGNVVIVYEAENIILGTYSLNSEGQLISENLVELPFNKISDTTLDYY